MLLSTLGNVNILHDWLHFYSNFLCWKWSSKTKVEPSLEALWVVHTLYALEWIITTTNKCHYLTGFDFLAYLIPPHSRWIPSPSSSAGEISTAGTQWQQGKNSGWWQVMRIDWMKYLSNNISPMYKIWYVNIEFQCCYCFSLLSYSTSRELHPNSSTKQKYFNLFEDIFLILNSNGK